jgi:hypothetical protein
MGALALSLSPLPIPTTHSLSVHNGIPPVSGQAPVGVSHLILPLPTENLPLASEHPLTIAILWGPYSSSTTFRKDVGLLQVIKYIKIMNGPTFKPPVNTRHKATPALPSPLLFTS